MFSCYTEKMTPLYRKIKIEREGVKKGRIIKITRPFLIFLENFIS
jgi:hypothetical protein